MPDHTYNDGIMTRKSKRIALTVLAIVVAGVAAAHWYYADRGRFTTEPQFTGLGRSVAGNDLVSTYDPALTLRFDPAFRFIGGQKFVLYGVADTEQYFFVQTTEDDKLKSIYWVQYEAYLPDNRYTYDYDDSPLRVSLGDYEFFTDTAAFHYDPNKKRARGTDGAMVRQFLASKDYAYPSEVMYARLVYLTDPSRRKELMVIYMEDLDAYGLTAEALNEGGAKAARYPDVEKRFLGRIRNTLTVLQ